MGEEIKHWMAGAKHIITKSALILLRPDYDTAPLLPGGPIGQFIAETGTFR